MYVQYVVSYFNLIKRGFLIKQNPKTQYLSKYTSRGKMLSRTLGNLHNLSRRVPIRTNFAACQAVNVLVPLLKEEVALFSAKSLLVLACLIDEDNNHLIMADEGRVHLAIMFHFQCDSFSPYCKEQSLFC